MKTKLLINTRIIDPQNNIDEVGGILIDENGKIKAVGKNVNKNNVPKDSQSKVYSQPKCQNPKKKIFGFFCLYGKFFLYL